MTESAILERVRSVALWAAIGAAALLVILIPLFLWGTLELFETRDVSQGYDAYDSYGSIFPQPTVWLKVVGTIGTVFSLAGTILLTLLVASNVKKEQA